MFCLEQKKCSFPSCPVSRCFRFTAPCEDIVALRKEREQKALQAFFFFGGGTEGLCLVLLFG